jgi:inorganic phosphate transporter, PiT family
VDGQDIVLVLVVATALAFDFTNGFHDTANAMATSIATRALRPKVAVGLAAVLNFVGAFISLKVAATIAEGIVKADAVTPIIIFAGLLGGIFWNLLTWRLGLPSSSSHALIGGVVGAVLVAAGPDAVLGEGLVSDVLVPAVVAPVLAGAVAFAATFLVYRATRRSRPEPVRKRFRAGQVASASLVALSHGTNDAQKTMGVIVLALVANGSLPAQDPGVPAWVVVAAASAIALGTYVGGWRIIQTLGSRVTEIQTPQGFSAETSAATVILAASNAGFPLSTTHVTSGSVLGSGVGRRAANVRWGVAGQMATAWLLTLPAAAAMAALFYLLTEAFGAGAAAAIAVGALAALAAGALYAQTQRGAGRVTAGDV